MIALIIGLSISNLICIILFILLYKQVISFNSLYLSLKKDIGINIFWDFLSYNKFDIVKIVSSLGIPSGTRLYSANKNEMLYLYSSTGDDLKVKVLVDGKVEGFRFYDKYGINKFKSVKRRRPKNCEIFLTPALNKLSWYCLSDFRIIDESILSTNTTINNNFSIEDLRSSIDTYCSKYCFLECKNICPIKKNKDKNNKLRIIESINRFCTTCESDCSKSCPLYTFKAE